jgi:5-methylcytosine-specific restriction endonuclease McrA
VGIERPDRNGWARAQFDKNKKKIYATQDVCGICGRPVDFNLKYPDPMSPTIDHIIPVAKGGHPSDIDNLQLAHFRCNRMKSDKAAAPMELKKEAEEIGISNLPWSLDWTKHSVKQ